MPTVKQYKVTPLKFDQNIVDLVTRRRTDGESISAIAKSLKLSAGKAAMAELIGTTERVTIDDPAKLARAVAKARKEGKSWGWLAARFGVTEGTARAAYESATGEPFTTLDYRRVAKKTKPAATKKRTVKRQATTKQAAPKGDA